MKCLSLAEPMASAIFAMSDDEWKRVENRHRRDGARPGNILRHRGPLLIHASSRWIPEHWAWMHERGFSAGFDAAIPGDGPLRDRVPYKRILGVVEVIGEVGPDGVVANLGALQRRGLTAAELRWWMHGFGLVFGARRAFPPMKAAPDAPAMWPALTRPGALGIFNVPDHVAGSDARCPAWSPAVDAFIRPQITRCVFGSGHTCPHADQEGFGWT